MNTQEKIDYLYSKITNKRKEIGVLNAEVMDLYEEINEEYKNLFKENFTNNKK